MHAKPRFVLVNSFNRRDTSAPSEINEFPRDALPSPLPGDKPAAAFCSNAAGDTRRLLPVRQRRDQQAQEGAERNVSDHAENS